MLLNKLGGVLELKKLIRLANHLDSNGLYKEADDIDDVIKKLAATEDGDYIYLSKHKTLMGTGLYSINKTNGIIFMSLDLQPDITLDRAIDITSEAVLGDIGMQVLNYLGGKRWSRDSLVKHVLEKFIEEADSDKNVLAAVKKASDFYQVPVQIPSSPPSEEVPDTNGSTDEVLPYTNVSTDEDFIKGLPPQSTDTTPAPAATAPKSNVYRVGSPDSDNIGKINQALKDMGFDVNLENTYSDKTKTAVEKFQGMVNSDNNYTGADITVDGIVGQVTLGLLTGEQWESLRGSIKGRNAQGGVGSAAARPAEPPPAETPPAAEDKTPPETPPAGKVTPPGSYTVLERKDYDKNRSVGIIDLDPQDTMKYQDLKKRFKLGLSTSGPNGPFGIARKGSLTEPEKTYLVEVRKRITSQTRMNRRGGQRRGLFGRRRR